MKLIKFSPSLYPSIRPYQRTRRWGILNISTNSTGPSRFPFRARVAPTDAATIRKQPQKKVSPIGASGPIRADFTALMVGPMFLSWLLAFFSSRAVTMPTTKLVICTVRLKNSVCRLHASTYASLSSLYSFFNNLVKVNANPRACWRSAL